MQVATDRCSKLPPRSARLRSAGTTKVPLKARTLKDHIHQHKNGFCEYCWSMETPATLTLLDETSAGLSDNPFTEDDEDEAFSDSSSISSCLDEDKGGLQRDIKEDTERNLEVMTMPRMALSPMECEIVTHRRVIRRRISRPSPLPSLYRASINSQEATSGSDSGFGYGAPKRALSSANVTSSQSWNYRNGMMSGPQSPAPGYSSMRSMGGSLRSGSAYLGSQGYSARRERLKQEAEQAEAIRQGTQRINHVAASSNDLRSTSLHQQRRQHYHSMSTIQPERTEFEEIETVTLQPIGRGVQDLGSNMGSTATLNRAGRRPVASSMLEGLNRVDPYRGNRQPRANMPSFGRQTSAMDISQTMSARPQRAASNSFLSSLRRQSTGTVSDVGSFRPIEISTNKPSSFATQQQKQHQQQQQFQLNSSTSKYSSTMQQQQVQPVLLQSSSQQLKSQQIQHQQQIQKSQCTKQKMEWNNNHNQNTTNNTSVNIAAPVPVNGQLVDLSLVKATSPVWYRLKISRQEAISILKSQPTGSFLVRDSTTFKDAYGLAVKSSKPPNKPGQKSGFAKFMKNILNDINNDLVRHYLIETVTTPTRGVRIKGFSAEQVFPNLLALIQYHTQYPVALPCCLVLPPLPSSQTSAVVTNTASNSSLRNGNGNTNGDSDSITLVQNNGIRSLNQTPTSFNGNIATAAMPTIPTTRGESLDTPNPSRSITSPLSPTLGMFHSELISPPPNISCRCLYLGAVEVDSNQPEQTNLMAAVDTLIPGPVLQAATCDQLGAESPIQYAECQLQVAHNEGILLTDLSRKLFFQRHFSANSFIYAGIDHRDKAFLHPNHSALGIEKPKLFGFIIKKLSGEYMAHIFSEFDANYGALIVTAQINSLLLNK
nr:tensin [Hymenolepis microstoma]